MPFKPCGSCQAVTGTRRCAQCNSKNVLPMVGTVPPLLDKRDKKRIERQLRLVGKVPFRDFRIAMAQEFMAI